MSLWEYKVITSGKGGFATPALLEKFLNDLGKDEWEIIEFRTLPDNALAFSGLARRTTQRDWTLEDAAAAAARTEADKLRAEFEAKFKGASGAAGAASDTESQAGAEAEKAGADDGLRRLRDTSADLDPDAPEDEPKDEWDMLVPENDLPNFFEAIRPHLRRNQRGPGMSAGVDFLAKKWQLSEEDVKTALIECGFVVPTDEDDKPVYIEFEGDLYWLNLNRRGELWINTKEKPRPVFRTVQGTRVTPEEPDRGSQNAEGRERPSEGGTAEAPAPREPKPEVPAEPAPQGNDLLEKIRPLMRRNRHGPGWSGSTSFLSRSFKCTEADLVAAFAALGLVPSPDAGDKPALVEIGDSMWWINQDKKGGIWINGRVKSEEQSEKTAENAQPELAPVAAEASAIPPLLSDWPPAGNVLAGARLLLKEIKEGSFASELGELARALNRDVEGLTATLIGAGLKLPEKPREKPVFVEHAGEIFWLNLNARGEVWLNAKASKFSSESDEKKGNRRPKPAKQEA